jgi:hypothetical protein
VPPFTTTIHHISAPILVSTTAIRLGPMTLTALSTSRSDFVTIQTLSNPTNCSRRNFTVPQFVRLAEPFFSRDIYTFTQTTTFLIFISPKSAHLDVFLFF